MQTLTIAQIDEICQSVVNSTQSYNPLLHACMYSIYFTGCRSGEIADLSRWRPNDDKSMALQTIKRGGIRIIDNSLLHPVFVAAILDPPSSSFLCSKRNMRSAFDTFSPFQSIYTLDKQISMHLFRHNRIKQLYAAGWSLLQLTNYFAVHSPEVPSYYINSVIYTP